MKKEKIVFVMALISIIISSIISVYAANYLYNSQDVEYDNIGKNITSTNVQGAIDELYAQANDYTELKSYFKNNPTSYFDGNTLQLGKTNTTTNTNLNFYNKNTLSGAIYGRNSDNALVITTQEGQTLDIAGDPVMINGVDVSSYRCQRYSGVVEDDGYLTVTHNKGLGSNYYPVVSIGANNVNAEVAYNVQQISNNYFRVGIVCINGLNLSTAVGHNVTINWCY